MAYGAYQSTIEWPVAHSSPRRLPSGKLVCLGA